MLKLVRPEVRYKEAIIEMIDEWKSYNESHPAANSSPTAIFKTDPREYEAFMESVDNKGDEPGKVPSTTYFLYDEEREIMIGAINIRHYLNEFLLRYGGHIGDGIRPSERGKGYATKMIALGLDVCRELGIERVLMVCDQDSVASSRTIIKNGGILEDRPLKDGKIIERYWIDISDQKTI